MSTQPISRPTTPPTWPSPVRRWAGAVSIVGLLAALLGSTLTDPSGDSYDAATQLRDTAGHLGAVQATIMLELLAATFAIGTIAAFLGVTRQRGSSLTNAGAIIGIPGCVGMALIAAHRLFIYALVSSHTPNPLQALDHLDAAVGPIPILFFAMPLAMLLFAAAAVRARIAPPAILALAVLFVVLDFIPAIPEHEILQLGAGLLAFGWIAWRITQLAEPTPASTSPRTTRTTSPELEEPVRSR